MTAASVSHTDRAHAVLGASASHRWLNCPGSVALSEGIPGTTSPHAEEGTRAHELLEAKLRQNDSAITAALTAARQAGDDIDELINAVSVAVDHVRGLEGAKMYEERVDLEALNPPGPMYGTVDVAVWNAGTGTLEIVDYKHGQGVVVEVEDNTQLAFYALGMILRLRVKPELIRCTVVQPRAHHQDGPVRTMEMSWDEMKAFKDRLIAGAEAAMSDDPQVGPVGDHCRWCKAKAICPAQRDNAMELAQIEFDVVDNEPLLPAPAGLDPDHLSLILTRAGLVEDWLAAVRQYAHDLIDAGEEVPGYKLVEGRRSRQWQDEEAAEAWLRQRFKVAEVFTKKLASPAQAEKLVKGRARLEIPEEMILVVGGKPKLAPADSPKPALNSGEEFPTLEEV